MNNRLPPPTLGRIVLAIALQLGLLLGLIAWGYSPIGAGTEVLIRVQPLDPRDLLRGNYVALRYEFSDANLDSITHDMHTQPPREGERLFVCLAPDSSFPAASIFKPVALMRNPERYERSAAGACQRLTVRVTSVWNNQRALRISSGLEAYYCNPEEALQWESVLRDSAQVWVAARVRVTSTGKSRLVGLRQLEFPPSPIPSVE